MTVQQTISIVMTGQLPYAPYQSVFWTVPGSPDPTGAQSGYGANYLLNIGVDSISVDGAAVNPLSLTVGGDLFGSLPNPLVAGIQNQPVAPVIPLAGQLLTYTGTQWLPQFRTYPGETFSAAIILNNPTIQTVPVSSGNVILRLQPGATQVEGVTKYIYLPAGHATGIDSASLSALNISGDSFTTSSDFLISISKLSGRIFGTIKNIGVNDSTSPTIVSAKVDQVNNPTILTLTMSEAVYIADLTGLSLTVTTGSALVLSSIVTTSNGSSILKFNLSRSVINSDRFSLVVSGSNIQDLNGNLIQNVTFVVALDTQYTDIPGCVLQFNALPNSTQVTLSGSNVLNIKDQSVVNSTIYGSSGHYPTYIANTGDGDNTGSLQFTGVSGSEEWLTIDAPFLNTTQDWTMCFLMDFQAAPGGTYNGFFCFDDSGGNQAMQIQRSDVSQIISTIANNHPALIYGTATINTWYFLIVSYTAVGRVVSGRVNMATAITANGDAYPAGPATNVRIGAVFGSQSLSLPSNSKMKAIGAWNRILTTNEQNFIHTFTQQNFTVCP